MNDVRNETWVGNKEELEVCVGGVQHMLPPYTPGWVLNVSDSIRVEWLVDYNLQVTCILEMMPDQVESVCFGP